MVYWLEYSSQSLASILYLVWEEIELHNRLLAWGKFKSGMD